MVEQVQKKLQNELAKYKQVQKEYQKTISMRQQLEGKMHENIVVKEELNRIKTGCDVYKLIGPVLVKQELVDAKENIAKRIEFIVSEIKNTENKIKSLDEQQEIHRTNLERIQQNFQKAQKKAANSQ